MPSCWPVPGYAGWYKQMQLDDKDDTHTASSRQPARPQENIHKQHTQNSDHRAKDENRQKHKAHERNSGLPTAAAAE